MKRRTIFAGVCAVVISALGGIGAWRLSQPKPPPVVELPRKEAPPHGQRFNAASFRYGPTLRASSMHHAGGHYLPFAVDEASSPPLQAKWASDANDRSPYFEVQFREPVRIESVVVALSGSHPSDNASNKRLEVQCLVAKKVVKTVPFTNNREPKVTATIDETCEAIHIPFRLDSSDDDIARVFEVEAWGVLP